MGMEINDDIMKIVLQIMSHYPELYNRVSNLVYKNFKMSSAEINLFASYIVLMTIKNDTEFVKKMLEDPDDQ